MEQSLWTPNMSPFTTKARISIQMQTINPGCNMTTSSNGNISGLLAICAGNSSVTRELPHPHPTHKGQRRGALMFSLIRAWINGWVNNRESGDLRRDHAHYYATVMNRYYLYLLPSAFRLSAQWCCFKLKHMPNPVTKHQQSGFLVNIL